MKRYGVLALLFLFMSLAAAYMAGASSVVRSKHDLSRPELYGGTGPGPIQSSNAGTKQVCVFCHTPHGSASDAPLWNRTSNIIDTYQLYFSDVMQAMTYPQPEDPKTHIKTRICLSCHDGTIALGKMANLPYPFGSDIAMQGTVGNKIPNYAVGYIGTDLRDDHPVAIPYKSGSGLGEDPELELTVGTTVNGNRVWLYKADLSKTNNGTMGAYVECTSCHNAHDNQYGKFLVDENSGSKICRYCHVKWTGPSSPESAHDLATTATYSPPTGGTPAVIGDHVSDVKCMTCHFPHKAGITDTTQLPKAYTNADYGTYLLTFKEEQSCYNSPDRWNRTTAPCHGSNGGAVKNIKDLVASGKTSKHPVDMNTTPVHQATEARGVASGWLGAGNAKWHVECADCHNPHTAGKVSHTAIPPVPIVPPMPALGTSSSLYGTGGVRVDTWPNSWATPNFGGSYTYLDSIGVVDKIATGAQYEYQICLKCHSNFAWLMTPPDSPSFAPEKMTNQALEFNPGNIYPNASAHPVAGRTQHSDGTLVPAWNANKGNQTMYCSDCHNNSSAPPQGPHGSNNKFVLFSPFDDALGTGGGSQQNGGDLCMVCHDPTTYLTPSLTSPAGTGFKTAGGLNLHASHAYRAQGSGSTQTPITSPKSYKCVNCHTRVPHGWFRRGMVVINNDGATYGAQYEAGGIGAGLINSAGFSQPATPGNYNYPGFPNINNNCSTAAGCHHN